MFVSLCMVMRSKQDSLKAAFYSLFDHDNDYESHNCVDLMVMMLMSIKTVTMMKTTIVVLLFCDDYCHYDNDECRRG